MKLKKKYDLISRFICRLVAHENGKEKKKKRACIRHANDNNI